LILNGKIQPKIDKWPVLAVQINFQKSEKKTCHPLKCWLMPNPKPSLNLAKTMEKLPKTNRRIKIEFVRLASVASVGFSLLFAANTFGQAPPLGGGPPPSGAPAPAAEATAERVIVTGSNIPTSEETGPNPVDTYRTEDLQKLGVVNQTDLLNKLPIEAGGTVNQNIANGGDGAVTPNLRGLLPKETLVLVDGKRVAQNANGLAWTLT
jgi:hypothetical protein